MKSARRAVITGIGLVSPLGNACDALWAALMEGRSGVGRFESLPGGALPVSIAAEAKGFTGDIENFGPLEKEQKKAIRKGLKVMCREIQMGVAAAQLALVDARLSAGAYPPGRSGCVFGSDYMMTVPDEFNAGIDSCRGPDGEFAYSRWAEEGMPKLSPLWLLKYLPNMPASHVAIYNDLRGPNNSITHREASANLAVGEAFRTITRGHADMMVAGATGTRVHPMKAVHAHQTEELAENKDPARACRPFDRDRTGMVMGEGAGTIILEELSHAQARGATILAEVIGHASSQVADRNSVAKRDLALTNVLRKTLADAQAKPEDVGHIHAHGLATRTCDVDEANAIRAVFGPIANKLPIAAAKSYFGNLGAGSGLVEIISSILALRHERLFPVLNFQTPDPECPIHVAQRGMPAGSSFINLNVTPQGQASAVMIRAL